MLRTLKGVSKCVGRCVRCISWMIDTSELHRSPDEDCEMLTLKLSKRDPWSVQNGTVADSVFD